MKHGYIEIIISNEIRRRKKTRKRGQGNKKKTNLEFVIAIVIV
jgi:hypothetical protein